MSTSSHDSVLVVTTNDLPGYQINEVFGEVFGLTVRSRNAFSQKALTSYDVARSTMDTPVVYAASRSKIAEVHSRYHGATRQVGDSDQEGVHGQLRTSPHLSE
ncbi:MAG: heavy metal-binding domain-containing protein [Pseudonocardiaceae bacterium]